jgi:TetR/AcrR family transcriptional regulator, cholesterol catabolism regulator
MSASAPKKQDRPGQRKRATLPARRAGNGPRRRGAEIIQAAAKVFAERGYHGATTQDIADVLGIRQASLYYYFQSKEIALEQVCLQGVEGYVEQAAAIANKAGSAAEKLGRIIYHHLAPMTDRPDFVRVFQRERRHLPDASRRRVGRLARKYERVVEEVIEAGVKSGEFRSGTDSRVAALAIVGMCNAATAWYGIEPDASLERITGGFARLLISGLARPGSVLAPRSRR